MNNAQFHKSRYHFLSRCKCQLRTSSAHLTLLTFSQKKYMLQLLLLGKRKYHYLCHEGRCVDLLELTDKYGSLRLLFLSHTLYYYTTAKYIQTYLKQRMPFKLLHCHVIMVLRCFHCRYSTLCRTNTNLRTNLKQEWVFQNVLILLNLFKISLGFLLQK